MSFDWKKFLLIADYLFNKHLDSSLLEANYRTIIGRAYYAAHWTARSYAERKMKVTFDSGEIHKKVVNCLLYGRHVEKEIGVELNSLLRNRVISDYKNDAIINFVRTAEESIISAKEIINSLEKM